MTLFNRGKSDPELFKDLDQRVGDRNTSDYASLATGAWDLVVDTSCYIPGHVTAAIEALDGRAGHYLVVSTLSVYTNSTPEKGPWEFAETDPVATIEAERLLEFSEIGDVGKYGSRYYGALKALCEEAARKALPGAVTVVRPGLIVGPGDISDRFTYWAVRVAEGGRIMAPGDPGAPVQYVDVRDLGTFIFETGARRSGKVINAVGFDRPVTMRDALASCIPAEQSADGARFTWVSDEFLMAQEIAPWLGLPLWIPGSPDTYSNSVARKEGLRFRPSRRPPQRPWPGTGARGAAITVGEPESRVRRRSRRSRHGTPDEGSSSPSGRLGGHRGDPGEEQTARDHRDRDLQPRVRCATHDLAGLAVDQNRVALAPEGVGHAPHRQEDVLPAYVSEGVPNPKASVGVARHVGSASGSLQRFDDRLPRTQPSSRSTWYSSARHPARNSGRRARAPRWRTRRASCQLLIDPFRGDDEDIVVEVISAAP